MGATPEQVENITSAAAHESARRSAEPGARRITIGHISGEVFDSAPKRKEDYLKIFNRDADILTGTEVPSTFGPMRHVIESYALDAEYWPFFPGHANDGWIAMKKDLVPGGLKGGYIPVTPGSHELHDPHPYGPRGVTHASGVSPDLGRISMAVFHFLTKGRFPGQAQKDAPHDPVNHYKVNKEYGRAIGEWAKDAGKGSGLAFADGDSNLIDKKTDIFNGQPLTTCWDELGKHPNTGHGNIDVIASLDWDKRVKCTSARVFTDKDLFLNGDHFYIEAVYQIRLLHKG